METFGIDDHSAVVSNPETVTIKKFNAWENCLFGVAVFCILMPPGMQNGIAALMLIWFFARRAWRDLPFHASSKPLPKGRPLWSMLALIRAEVPGFYPLIVGVLGSVTLTVLAVAVGSVLHPPESSPGKVVASLLKLIDKQGVYSILMITVFLAARCRGWRLANSLPLIIGLLGLNFVYMLAQRYWGIDWVHGFDATISDGRYAYGVYRASGFIAHPLTFGYNSMLLTVLTAGLGLWSTRDSSFGRPWQWALACALSAGALFLSGSRWPLAVTFGVGFIMLAPSIKRYAKWAIPVVAVVILGVWLEGSTVSRMREIIGPLDTIEERIPRVVFWKVHWAMFTDHPVAGVGYTDRVAEALDYYDKAGYTYMKEKYNAHNIYLQTLADSGLIGFAGMLCLLAGIGRAAREVSRRRKHAGLMAVVAATIVAGLMQNILRDSEYMFALWTSVSLYLSQLAFQADRGGSR